MTDNVRKKRGSEENMFNIMPTKGAAQRRRESNKLKSVVYHDDSV